MNEYATRSGARWVALTPAGALHAFSEPQPDAQQQALQTLLRGNQTLTTEEWFAAVPAARDLIQTAMDLLWIEKLARALPGPDTQLDNFIQQVIAPLSGERRAALASDSGFSLGYAGMEQEEAEIICAASADHASFAQRQRQRDWPGKQRYVSFFNDPHLLIPEWSFVPFWVEGNGYCLILAGEPLVNNLALVELLWGIHLAGQLFAPDI